MLERSEGTKISSFFINSKTTFLLERHYFIIIASLNQAEKSCPFGKVPHFNRRASV